VTLKEAVGEKMAVRTVGFTTTGKQTNDLLEDGLDLAIVGAIPEESWLGVDLCG